MQQDATCRRFQEATDEAKQGGLAAAAGSQEHEVLTAGDVQVDGPERDHGAVIFGQTDRLDRDVTPFRHSDITGVALAQASRSRRFALISVKIRIEPMTTIETILMVPAMA